jgi:dTDP-L-rhamnose 4-epimerase
VVDELVVAGFAVRVLDVLHPAAHDGLPDYLNPAADYVWGDLCRPETVLAAVEDVEVVSHQAAMVGLGVDFEDAPDYVANNDGGTAALLWALHRRHFSGRLVLGSSMAVYGEGAYACPDHGPVRPGPRSPERLEAAMFDPPCPECGATLHPEPVGEEAPVDPRSVYAATKLHQEHLCAVFGREHGSAVTTLRYHNVYGPRMPRDTPYAGVASIFRSALEQGRPAPVFEDGGQRRDFVHVADVARANALALGAGTPVPGVFNVASGEPRTVLDMAAAITAAFGPDTPTPEVTGRCRPGDVRHVFASPARARQALGFEARVAFEDGMAEFARAPLRGPSSRSLRSSPGAGARRGRRR